MKSKEIRVRNLPKDDVPFYVSNVKPTSFLIVAMIASNSSIFISPLKEMAQAFSSCVIIDEVIITG